MAILGADNFANNGRVLTNGWNGSYDGQTWAILSGGPSFWSVTAGSGGVGGKGQITGTTNAQVGALGTGTSVDLDLRCRVSVSATGDSVGVSGRMTASNTAYRTKLQNNVFTLLVIISGSATTLASQAFTVTPGTLYQLHLRLRGSAISANAWLDGTIEPSGFMLTGTDTQITTVGRYGVVTGLAATGDSVTYDQFVATNPTYVTDNPYGVTIGLTNKNPPTNNYANWHSLFADFYALGLSWLRFQIDWKLIQQDTMQFTPSSGWTWAPLDNAVSRCNEAGIYITHALRGAPTWALPGPSSYQYTTEPAYAMDYNYAATFAGVLATRYNGASGFGTLNSYEVGNEEFNIHFTPASPPAAWRGLYNSPYPEYNGLSFVNINTQPARDPHGYKDILTHVSSSIRAAAPSMKVGGAAVWWNQYPNCADFYSGLYTEIAGLASKYDFANFHYYSNTRDPSLAGSGTTYSPSFQQEWTTMQAALVAKLDAGKPIWVTEFGWSTNTNVGNSIDCPVTGPGTTGQDGRYQYVLNNAKGSSGAVQKVFIFTLNYGTQNGAGQAITQSASVVQWDVASQSYIKLPAWAVIQTFIATNPVWVAPAVVTVPAVSRRTGSGIPGVARRDGTSGIAAARRDGSIPAIARRNGVVTAKARRKGAVPAISRRG